MMTMLDQRIPYIGISPYMKASQNSVLRWLDHCFTRITVKDGIPLCKTHGFGVTGHRIVRRYPWFSVDSTTWALSAAYGNILLPRFTKAGPDYSHPRQFRMSDRDRGSGSGNNSLLDIAPWDRRIIATYLACFHDFRQYLAPGERGMVQLIASDKKQAKQMLRYIGGFFDEIPLLKKLLEREVAETFDLTNRITIEMTTASMKATRGFTVVLSILDEAAYFSTDEGSASPDAEILKAIVPSTLTIPNALILVSSSPYARRGILYQAHKDYFGKPERDRTLVWQASTLTMNPSADADFIAREYEKDPAAAASEYGALFRTDLEAFVDIDVVMACVSEGIYERPRERGIKYQAFLDPAGGSGKDSFTLAIGHRDKASGMSVLDAIRETKPPFSPEVVVEDYAKVLKSFGITKCIGDRYAGMWVVEPFRKFGIAYDPNVAKPKSDLYRDALPLLNSRKADLLDHKKLVQQFVGLERRTARSGKDSIDHGPNGYDDLCNVVAGLLCNLGTKAYRYISDLSWVASDEEMKKDHENWRASQLVNHVMRGSFGRLF
jgi:hypothetical protein